MIAMANSKPNTAKITKKGKKATDQKIFAK